MTRFTSGDKKVLAVGTVIGVAVGILASALFKITESPAAAVVAASVIFVFWLATTAVLVMKIAALRQETLEDFQWIYGRLNRLDGGPDNQEVMDLHP